MSQKLNARVKRQCLRSVILTCEREEASKNAADIRGHHPKSAYQVGNLHSCVPARAGFAPEDVVARRSRVEVLRKLTLVRIFRQLEKGKCCELAGSSVTWTW
jgi:hypothetical protein